jgi:WD40 repeat protein
MNSVLMSSCEDGSIFFWDITPLTYTLTPSFPYYHFLGNARIHSRFICQLKFDSVNKLLFSVSDDGFVHAWNIPRIDPVYQHTRTLLFDYDLITFSLNHNVNYVQSQNSLSQATRVLFCDISLDGKYLATGASDGKVRLWRIPQLQRDPHQFARTV